jgi:CRISPR/Cas system-associated exonuclease Cas4 (RecB family)
MLPSESEGPAAHESGESCLFYVGVTRARDHLVLSYSERYGKRKYKRSLYLDALEAGLADDRMTKLYWDGGRDEHGSDGGRDESGPGGRDEYGSYMQPSEDFVQAMKPPTLHVSAIEAYQRCPRQYAYSSIYHFQSEEGAYRLFWRATQKTLEELRQQAQEQDTNAQKQAPTSQEIQDLYTRHWQELGGPGMPFAALYEQHGQEVAELVRRTLATQRDITWDLWAGYSVDIAGQTVHVTVDRVEASMHSAGTPVKFVRARFGKRKDKPTPDTRELLYARAYRQLHPGQQVELHSHNLSTGEVVPITLTSKKEQSLYEEVEKSILGLERNEYPAMPAEPFRCPGCPFFWICPA